mgnify:CR=1 FL=1
MVYNLSLDDIYLIPHVSCRVILHAQEKPRRDREGLEPRNDQTGGATRKHDQERAQNHRELTAKNERRIRRYIIWLGLQPASR